MKQIYLKISDAKETPYARKLRIAETENGRKLRCRVVQSKKKYKRSREVPDFNFLCIKGLQLYLKCIIFPYKQERNGTHICKNSG